MKNSWLEKILPNVGRPSEQKKANIPEGLWKQCPKCGAFLYRPELEVNLDVCPKCDHHLRVTARQRLNLFLDEENRVELSPDLTPVDRLKFKDTKKYKDRLTAAQKTTEENDALISIQGQLKGLDVVAVAFEFRFLGGSMGSIVGEKFVRAAHLCLEKRIPLICFSASGGARMQEALTSLMQMAKTSAALEKMRQQGIPYISVMTDPVYGGVSASWLCWGMRI